ncbi:hypothetical protein PVAP13_1KG255035 [Panicum virgatum]|nr:hypothetical protein PVAP13_1KG255035 [Panicum virgatum]
MPSAASLLTAARHSSRAARAARSAARAASRAVRSAAAAAASSRSARPSAPVAASFGPHWDGLGGDSCSYQTSFSGIDPCSDPVSPDQFSGVSSPDVSELDRMNRDTSELDFVAQEAKLQDKVDLPIHEDDLVSDEAMWSLYERWCKVFNQERDSDEMARRFKEFKENVLLGYRVNNSGLPYKLELNEFIMGS